ncbi:hypothetical protein DEO72_LG5g1972 [Vigna unguiculata]|uniref:Uncharacterized protein n=1 Tax=Vigna unguiculata TaxID=3917 RepID=A0A4D6M124_VIGUN|nr:hypothetical protein DEO72_LG5g1972 [Vigna unguiculata]
MGVAHKSIACCLLTIGEDEVVVLKTEAVGEDFDATGDVEFKMKHQLNYGEDDCPITALDEATIA